jgi:hypothetical protein
MKKKTIALGWIASAVVLAIFFFGLHMFSENKRGSIADSIEPLAAIARYERLVALNEAADETAAPDETAAASDSDSDSDLIALETMAQYQASFDLFSAVYDADAWKEIQKRLNEKNFSEWSDDELADLDANLAANNMLILKIRELAKRGGPIYPLDFSKGHEMELPHLDTMRAFACMLRDHAIISARRGNYEEAVEDIIAGMQLADALVDEPVLVSQLLRIVMTGIMRTAIEDGFGWGELPPRLAEDIIRQAARADHRGALTNSLRGHRQVGLNAWPVAEDVNFLLRLWLKLDMAGFGELMDRMINVSELDYYESLPAILEIEDDVDNLSFTRLITQILAPRFTGIQDGQAGQESQLDLLQVGLALESHYARTGAYPETLDAVDGAIPGGLPVDPFTGDAYIYENQGATFLLYGVGRNLTDDGGVHDRKEGDIVWRGEEK